MNTQTKKPEGNKKPAIKKQVEFVGKISFLSQLKKEVQEVFSDRVNVIIIAGSFLIGSASVGGILLYEKNKSTPEENEVSERLETPESIEIRGKHERILNGSVPQTTIVGIEKKEIPNNEKEPLPPPSISNEKNLQSSKKEALKEEYLTKGTVSFSPSHPEDAQYLPDFINENLNGLKRK